MRCNKSGLVFSSLYGGVIISSVSLPTATNQMMLGREGCVTTIVTILNSVPKTHHAKIKFIMEILALLTKTSELPYCSCFVLFLSKLYLLSFIDSRVGFTLYSVVSYDTSRTLYPRRCHDVLISQRTH